MSQQVNTFIDSNGEVQHYFVAKDNDFWTPRKYTSETYDYLHSSGDNFYRRNLNTGTTIWEGFTDKLVKSYDYISENKSETANAIKEAFKEGLSECVNDIGSCVLEGLDNLFTTAISSGAEIGKNLVLNEQDKINALYGENVEEEMAVVSGGQFFIAAAELLGAGKVVTAGSKSVIEGIDNSLVLKQVDNTADIDTKKRSEEPDVVCATDAACFVAGTKIHTADGLKNIEDIQLGDLIWSREEFGDKYAYRPVVATKITEQQALYEVVVQNAQGQMEHYQTTEEHPFHVTDIGWLKASLLEKGMKLLDLQGKPSLEVVSQQALNKTETVYNFEVEAFHTYHIGEFGVWVHNDKCCDLIKQNPVQETKRGVISRTKLNDGAIELDTTPKTSQQAQDIAQNGDPTGMKTEALFNNVVKEHGGTVLDGGKYGSNNGYDHVVIFKDAEGNTYLTMVVDSKQLNSKGVVLNHNAAGGTMQMSERWEQIVLGQLDKSSEAYKAIQAAKENGGLVKGAAYVDKETGKLNLIRINPITRTK